LTFYIIGMTAFINILILNEYDESMYMANPEQLALDYNTNAMNNTVKNAKIY